MKKYIYRLLLIMTLASSCRSVNNDGFSQFSEAPLFGMIYDSESSPVAGAVVVLDNDKSAQSDINGRVLFGSVSRGDHSVVINKEGFEEVHMELNFSNRDQVLYSTLISLHNILDKLEIYMQTGKMLEAKSFLMRASRINSEDIRFRYLNVVCLIKNGEYEKALGEIEILRKSYPDDPYIVMTCAEILFHGVDKKEEALELLNNLPEAGRDEKFKNLIEEILSEPDFEEQNNITKGFEND